MSSSMGLCHKWGFFTCRLEDLWLNDNQIECLEGIAEAVTGSREKLTTIYLERNPCVRVLYEFGDGLYNHNLRVLRHFFKLLLSH